MDGQAAGRRGVLGLKRLAAALAVGAAMLAGMLGDAAGPHEAAAQQFHNCYVRDLGWGISTAWGSGTYCKIWVRGYEYLWVYEADTRWLYYQVENARWGAWFYQRQLTQYYGYY